ncbi:MULTISPECIES: dipeptidase [Pantoea]|jgi:membrane dipeptidase|uniref:dipeptidase n=1 Tax=Pantoea TaxID=53335 RepID=UPI000EA2B16F|nr:MULTISPECIES: dipeptidase [Pantoea]MBZ6399196.1 dipeptidase [Pantoea piersonii]NYB03258.1 dipeptidase [Pantoea piersonii]NYB07948.1 dipeptidase [Pantoea piersonii]NYB35346.1 dipeptidase [Pantoea piersonii]RKJ93360.1 peptidase [Pantoea piersonii]
MLTFDGHNDLLLNLWLNHRDAPVDAFFNGIERGHLDFPRMQQGGFFGGLFAIFVPPQAYIAQTTPHLADTPYQPLEIMWQQLAILQQIASQSQGRARLCRSAADIAACRAEGVLALVAHIEGADALDEEGEQLQAFYDAGVRSIGPFWNLSNRFGVGVTGAFPGSPDSGPGLTDAGKALIKQANALNMLIDVSHMNEKAFWDTAALSDSPLVATHSNAHALCAQPRNLTDAQLIAIRDSGGMVGINFGNAFLRADGKRDGDTPLGEIVRHYERLIMIMGSDHVGFGSDFDGISTPEALKDVSGLPRLFAAFRDAGYDQDRLEKLASANWQRVLQAIWRG